MEVKFFTTLYGTLLGYLFVRRWFSGRGIKDKSKVIIRHYVIIVGSRTLWTNAAVQNGSEILHIIVEKINGLLVCQQVIFWLSYKKLVKRYKTLYYHCCKSHTLDLCRNLKWKSRCRTSCLLVCRRFWGRVLVKTDYHTEIKVFNHCYKRHLGPMQPLKMEVTFFTSL